MPRRQPICRLATNITQYAKFRIDWGQIKPEIDHLLLTEDRIVVVETKTLTGQIFRLRVIKIPNPIRQNYGHVQAVQAALIGSTVPVSGQVVLASSATFPKGIPGGGVSRADLFKFLKARFTGTQSSKASVKAWESLENAAKGDKEAGRAHRKQIAARFGNDKKQRLDLGMIVAGINLAPLF